MNTDLPLWIQDEIGAVAHDDRQAQRDIIFQHLNDQLKPATPMEVYYVQEISLAFREIFEFDRRRAAAFRAEEFFAVRQFDGQVLDQYIKEAKKLRKSPALTQQLLATHTYGAGMLADAWLPVINYLGRGIVCDLLWVCEALLAEGLQEKIHLLSGDEPWWVMSRYLAIRPDIEETIEQWIKYSRVPAAQVAMIRERARLAAAQHTDRAVAMAELLEFARTRRAFWLQKRDELEPDHVRARQEQAIAYHPSRRLVSGMRLLDQMRKMHESRITHNYAYLEKSRELRLKTEKRQLQRLQREAARAEKRRQNRQSVPDIQPQEQKLKHNSAKTYESAVTMVQEVIVPATVGQHSGRAGQNQAEPAAMKSKEYYFNELITTMTDNQLAKIYDEPWFRSELQKAPNSKKKVLQRMVFEEKQRRNQFHELQTTA